MNSALCRGVIEHVRHTPAPHRFRYPTTMLYLDLSEVEQVFSLTRLWSATRAAPVRFFRGDYLGDAARPLDACVREAVQRELGFRPSGPIRMLTHPRHFGFVLNPITVYLCFGDDGSTIEAVVGDVTNVPWNERHTYVWPSSAVVRTLGAEGHRCAKQFHVSPFMPMEQTYRVRLVHRATGLALRLDTEEKGQSIFHAQLTLRKRPITAGALRAVAAGHPLLTAGVVARIYTQAARLWLKRIPFYPHPTHSTEKEHQIA